MSPLDGVHPGRRRVVGISEMAVSADPEDVLVTFSLGSCIGLSLYDSARRVGGLIHCMLPSATLDPEKARLRPAMFVDSGVTALLDALFDLGATHEGLVIKLAGGASHLCSNDSFRIGERNCTVLRKILWKNDLLLAGSDVGGCTPRTMSLYLASGATTVRAAGQETLL